MKMCGKANLAFAAVLVMASSVFAAESQDVRLNIERVALFKNGLGYFTSSAKLPDKATSINFGQLPVPSLGTFWVGYSKKVKVRGLFTVLEDTKEDRVVHNVGQLLSANIGRKVAIHMSRKEMPVVEGTLIAVTQPLLPEPPSPYLMESRRATPERRARDSVVLVKTDWGLVAVNTGAIIRADIEGDDVKTSFQVPAKQPRIRMELEKEAGGEEVVVSYLARGITWSPSYILDLSDPKTARLTAKAMVINEVADLDAVRLELVTGFPNIRFADVNSPVAMSQSLADFLQALKRGRSEERRRAVIMSQRAGPWGPESRDRLMPAYATARAGVVAEDLFLYPVDRFTMRRGDTAYIPLFTAEVPYKHVYIWKIPDFLDESERYRRQTERDGQPPEEEVWHACRLTNTMKMPWTTAPAQFLKDGQITGQDICYYTAPGAKTTIRINRAMNVLAEQAEFETERKRGAARFYGYTYDRVKVKGELKLRNKLEKAVTVEVTKDLSGDVLETTPEAKDIPTAKGLKRANTRHSLVWEVNLKPGEQKTLTYTYEVLVRH